MKNLIIFTGFLFFLILFKKTEASNSHKKYNRVFFGIDISEYQDKPINWKKVKKKNPRIKFVILRATMGDDRKDDKFLERMREVRKAKFTMGAYHYYDPNENSEKQAKNYLSRVKLRKGDFIPIVDLERLSRLQSMSDLKQGLKNWLNIVEKHYGVKPIIYTSYSFYLQHLKKDFKHYPLWVAAYCKDKRCTSTVTNCEIHQFTDNALIRGISCRVDGNDIQKNTFRKLILK